MDEGDEPGEGHLRLVRIVVYLETTEAFVEQEEGGLEEISDVGHGFDVLTTTYRDEESAVNLAYQSINIALIPRPEDDCWTDYQGVSSGAAGRPPPEELLCLKLARAVRGGWVGWGILVGWPCMLAVHGG